MATPNIVPRADQEGGLGTAAKSWGKLFIENAAAGGTAAVTISNLDVDKVALDINALNTTANVLDITAGALNGGASIYLNTLNGQDDLKLVSSADTGDYFSIGTTTHGATTLTTVDDDAAAAHFEIAADGNITLDAAGTTTIESAGLIKLDGEAGVEIENGAAAAALLIDNDTVDQIALDIDAANTTANVIDISATALTSAFGLAMDLDSLTSGGGAISIDVDDDDTTAGYKRLHLVDYRKTSNTPNSITNNVLGHSINLTDSATSNHAGSTHIRTGYASGVNFVNTTGTHAIDGFSSDINLATSGATSVHPGGIQSFFSKITDGEGVDFKAVSSADSGDQFTIETTTHGATTLTTVDDDAAAAHISVVADGNVDIDGLTITLDAATKIELEQNTDVTGDLGVSAEATVNSLICTNAAGFGGGYGSTGASISTAGVGQFNGALTTDAALTADNIVCTNAATFGGGTGSTGVTISTAGVVTADGLISSTASGVTGINYRTIWIDAGSMVPQVTNGAAAGTSESADAYDVMNDYFAFDASTIEFTQYKLAMPLQWNGGTIKAKFYWKPSSSTTTSHSVMWAIDGQAHADGGELGAWGTTVNVAIDDVIATDSPKKVHVSAASGAVTIAGSPAAGASELVYLRFQRVANHATDDLNEDAHLLGVAIQYQETAALQAAW